MEDDDEFGDLCTDVLRPFSSSLHASQPQQQPSLAPPSLDRPIDLNKDDDDDGDEILYNASHRNSPDAPSNPSLPDSAQNSIPTDNNSAGGARVLGSPDEKLPNKPSSAGDFTDLQSDKLDKEVNFDIEESNTAIIEDSSLMIPGLAVNADDSTRNEADVGGGGGGGGGGGEEGDQDWEEESDSEDDLQIVLNDANHGPMGMERGVMGDGNEDEDDDEDGDPLVIVADVDANQAMEEQDWGGGEDAPAAVTGGAEGERKEGSETSGKGNAVLGPKIGYSNHGYHHPFHSQFKVSVVVVVVVMC